MPGSRPLLRWLDARPAWLTIAASFLVLLLLWQLLVTLTDYPPFILPGPGDVAAAFVRLVADGRLLRHSLVTLSEVIPGLLLGALVATPLGYLLGYDYFLPDVPYVMYFFEDYAIHGTYWHSSFGTPMSHGCVNVSTPDAGWLFDWAPVGTLVNVRY